MSEIVIGGFVGLAAGVLLVLIAQLALWYFLDY